MFWAAPSRCKSYGLPNMVDRNRTSAPQSWKIYSQSLFLNHNQIQYSAHYEDGCIDAFLSCMCLVTESKVQCGSQVVVQLLPEESDMQNIKECFTKSEGTVPFLCGLEISWTAFWRFSSRCWLEVLTFLGRQLVKSDRFSSLGIKSSTQDIPLDL